MVVMSKKEVDNSFVELCGGIDKVRQRAASDWYSLQFDYQCYIDSLCKDGKITLNQYERFVMPWKKEMIK